jgi:23S rRNA (uracil1939-C5)-methyltransferase
MRLSIEKVVYGGSGIARQERQASAGTVFVPFTLPGEEIEADLVSTAGSRMDASVKELISASSDRVLPRCIHFGVCGGCQFQHASYEAQLSLKREILQETLQRAGLTSLPEMEIHAAEPWEYRNRIRLRLQEFDGQLRAGYLKRGSTEFLPIQMCPIAAPILWQAAEILLDVLEAFPQWAKITQEIELFTADEEQKIQITFFLRSMPGKNFAEFANALLLRMPQLAGAGALVIETEGKSRRLQRTIPIASWGAAGLNYKVGEESYWVRRGSFFQVNRFLVSRLVQLATGGRSGRLAWDLYAGVGLFSRVLAKSFAEVVAVEVEKGNLEANFRGEGRRAVAATTLEFLRQAVLERDRPELIVMDPPRGGVGTEVCSLIARLKTPEVVYVSCDPATLSRDLREMVDSGYNIDQVHLVDMFPQTFHQETVAVLRR